MHLIGIFKLKIIEKYINVCSLGELNSYAPFPAHSLLLTSTPNTPKHSWHKTKRSTQISLGSPVAVRRRRGRGRGGGRVLTNRLVWGLSSATSRALQWVCTWWQWPWGWWEGSSGGGAARTVVNLARVSPSLNSDNWWGLSP